MKNILTLAFLLSIFTSASFAQAPPMVDGSCDEYARLKAQKFAVSADVDLHIYQDKHFVWLCYTYPDGSMGTTDIKLKTPTFVEPINLHVSAQLGEWPVNKPELAPKDGESDLWWNTKGWTANAVWMNGLDTTGDTPRVKFKNAKAREIQIGKERFGRGTWTLSMNIRAIKGADGKMYKADFPKANESYTLKVK